MIEINQIPVLEDNYIYIVIDKETKMIHHKDGNFPNNIGEIGRMEASLAWTLDLYGNNVKNVSKKEFLSYLVPGMFLGESGTGTSLMALSAEQHRGA